MNSPPQHGGFTLRCAWDPSRPFLVVVIKANWKRIPAGRFQTREEAEERARQFRQYARIRGGDCVVEGPD